ncbi:MAG: mannose-6-phosphate isomerase, class I [Lachnospiraceae bacterium]|nr:mannose-6-phosphate isomerase, class I [Lachnospiraceae bacterium]
MKEILHIKPVFKQMIWGGNRLKSEYGYEIPGDNTGECWAISGHKNGDDEIVGGTYDGWKLSELYNKHRELFGNQKKDVFPLLVKIIDAKADLSIQVHPDDEYAAKNENGSLGKTECWYILDCDEDAKIVVGHNAKTKEELRDMICSGKWDELIKVRPIKKGDFFQIVPGTVHAIKAGTLILETQQSSDITYRLYDYGRLQNGKPRELHIEKSIDVIKCPETRAEVSRSTEMIEDAKVETLVSCEFYDVKKVDLAGSASFDTEGIYRLVSVIEGNGEINGEKIKKGDHFILPSDYGKYTITGNLSLISSFSKEA